ncbi:MAG: hypothetical protein H6713_16640 [Myxococcales bacterium]|nr:hypothetical protein [Myxococcales bacterium]
MKAFNTTVLRYLLSVRCCTPAAATLLIPEEFLDRGDVTEVSALCCG